MMGLLLQWVGVHYLWLLRFTSRWKSLPTMRYRNAPVRRTKSTSDNLLPFFISLSLGIIHFHSSYFTLPTQQLYLVSFYSTTLRRLPPMVVLRWHKRCEADSRYRYTSTNAAAIAGSNCEPGSPTLSASFSEYCVSIWGQEQEIYSGLARKRDWPSFPRCCGWLALRLKLLTQRL